MADENARDKSGDDYAEDDDDGWDDDEYWQEDEPKYIDEADARFRPQKELPQKLGTAARRTDAFFDSLLSRATGTAEKSREKLEEYAPKVKKGAKKVIRDTGTRIKKIDDYGDEYSAKVFRKDMFDKFIVAIIRNPLTFLIIVGLISGTIFYFGAAPREYGGADLQDNIRGDMNVYLPQGHETQETWDEIQEDWSTDIIVIFVETDNVIGDITRRGITNITDVAVLNDMSRVEETVDYDKEDRGREDGIVFVLSFSTLIKEMNSTLPRFADAIRYEFNFEFDLGMVEGEYTIPDQQIVDRIYEEIPPDASNSLIIDSNDDTIIDTSIILIGLHKDADQAKMLDLVEDTVRAEAHHCNMTLTGPIPMTHAITERTYSEVTKTLPAALLLVAAVLILFHRTWKIVVITSVPIVTSVGITFGILGITDMVLTPQVVLIAPVLIALGVAYGLYIANRYSDERDIEDREERIRKAVKTTGKAIFLSAVTTSIGFASLMTVQMIPLQVLGFGLSIGIMLCYVTTILTVPSLVMLLDYRKKGEIKSREKIGNIPVNNRKKIVGAAIIITIISAILIPSVAANMDYVKMAPQDEPVIQKMREYGEKFGGGDFGLILVTGDPAERDDIDDSMKDIEVLKDIEDLEEQINDDPNNANDPHVENAKALSIVTIMKTIKIPEFELQGVASIPWGWVQDQFEDYMNITFWDALKRAGDYPTVYNPMINIFYNTLTPELRGMFINEDYSKTIIYVLMPSMDVIKTEEVVSAINTITEKYEAGLDTSHMTGFGAILVAVNEMLVWSSVQSTIMAIALVLLVLTAIFRSFKFAAITLIPVCLVVIWQPITLISIGSLGKFIDPVNPYFGGELNLFTAVIGSIIVGIGIDFGIHMTERIRERGEDIPSVKHGVATSGMAFLEATITVSAGLSAVFLINIPAIQEFILLIIILLVYSVIAAIFILPAIYTILFRTRKAGSGEEPQEVEPMEMSGREGSITPSSTTTSDLKSGQ